VSAAAADAFSSPIPADHLLDNPSLKTILDASIASGYKLAILGAARETGLERDVFPVVCPWSFEQFVDPDFWPEHG
jgi:hypothetical protein